MMNGQVIDAPACPGTDDILAAGNEAAEILRRNGISYMVGGCVALWAYGRRRCTKDFDLFLPSDMPIRAMDVLTHAGFHTRDMDASWLYKAFKNDVLIDLIVWTTGSIRLDSASFRRTRQVLINGYSFPVMGPEDLLFRKILSYREETPKDWFDALSMMEHPIERFDWEFFLHRIGDQYVRRALSLFFYAQSEYGKQVVPAWALNEMLKRQERAPETPELRRPGAVSFMPPHLEHLALPPGSEPA